MQAFHKLVLLPPLVVLACLAAGIYGMAHDQLSYTVSPDYFHHLKFQQFGIGEHFHDRVGAAIVGWGATWWMGLVVGLPLSVVGLIIRGRRAYLLAVCKSFVLAIGTAVALGLAGLVFAKANTLTYWHRNYPFPEGVTDQEAFLEVGMMHNASYIGGGLGLLGGLVYLLVAGFKQRRERTAGQA